MRPITMMRKLMVLWICLALSGCQMMNLPAKAKAMQRAENYAIQLGMTADTRLTSYYDCYEFGGGCEAHIAFTTQFTKDTLDSLAKSLSASVSDRQGGGLSINSFLERLRSESSPTVTVSVSGPVAGDSVYWAITDSVEPRANVKIFPIAALSPTTAIDIGDHRIISNVIDIAIQLIKDKD